MINFLTYEDVSWVFYLLGFLHGKKKKKHMKYRHICSTWSVARFDPGITLFDTGLFTNASYTMKLWWDVTAC